MTTGQPKYASHGTRRVPGTGVTRPGAPILGRVSPQQNVPDTALTTLVGLAAYTELAAFGLLASRSVDAPDLPKLPVGRAVWKPAPDFATSAACWLAAGAAHHTVMTTAVGIEVFRDFAEIAATELVVIDEDTTTRGFQRELRWNQAYYRLAQGL